MGLWLRDRERAGPLETEIARRKGCGETTSVRRKRLSRLMLVAVRSMAFKQKQMNVLDVVACGVQVESQDILFI